MGLGGGPARPWRPRATALAGWATLVAAASVGAVLGDDRAGALAAPAVVLAAPAVSRELRSTVGWMAGGAGVLGAVGYLLATTLVTDLSQTALLGAGLAFGGGLGVLVRLFVVGETTTAEPDEVTVDMDESAPDPQPVDLFEANPDPVVFYEDGAVLAVNPAYEDTFGASTATLVETPLPGAVPAAGDDPDAAAIVRRVVEEGAAETLPCETTDGRARFRVRTAAVGANEGRSRGYLLFTRVE